MELMLQICTFLISLRITDSQSITAPVLQTETCTLQHFSPMCSSGDIVFIEESILGRLRLGPCMDDKWDEGCGELVTQHVSKECTNRRNCSIEVRFDAFKNRSRGEMNPCSSMGSRLASFLTTKYRCIMVDEPKVNTNGTSTNLILSDMKGYVSSRDAMIGGWGTQDTPLQIQASPGQNIQLCIINLRSLQNKPGKCKKTIFAEVNDGSETQSMNADPCDVSLKCQESHWSVGNEINVTMVTRKRHGMELDFLLYYKIHGCENPVAPSSGWVSREGGNATFGCNNSTTRWGLVCFGTTWIGSHKNCSIPVSAVISTSERLEPVSGSVIFLAVGLTAACIICVVLLYMVLVSWRRNRKFIHDMKLDSAETSLRLEEEEPSCSSSHGYHGYHANSLPRDRYYGGSQSHGSHKSGSLPHNIGHPGKKRTRDPRTRHPGSRYNQEHHTLPGDRGYTNYVKVMPDCEDCKIHGGYKSADRLLTCQTDKQNNREYAIRLNDNTIIKIEGEYASPRDSVEVEEPIYESPKEIQKKVSALRKCTNAGEALPNNLKIITITDPRSLRFRSNDITDTVESAEIPEESDV